MSGSHIAMSSIRCQPSRWPGEIGPLAIVVSDFMGQLLKRHADQSHAGFMNFAAIEVFAPRLLQNAVSRIRVSCLLSAWRQAFVALPDMATDARLLLCSSVCEQNSLTSSSKQRQGIASDAESASGGPKLQQSAARNPATKDRTFTSLLNGLRQGLATFPCTGNFPTAAHLQTGWNKDACCV